MSRALGNIAEDKASAYLRHHKFQIIERNFYTKMGEIDIIAIKDTVLHFVEVKSATTYDKAIQNITPKKMQRILSSVAVYLQKHHLELAYSVDAIIVVEDQITLIENITL